MNKLRAFISEAYQELRFKVSWPTWPELQSSTQLVLVAFLIISVIIFIMDLASKELLDLFYGLF
ncbi:MAG: preprotein translocase subunit SecE [Chitinophagales bacterium]|nr:preprotein translocase subunit SecE [Bacteroidota bacterium]HRF75934.1 preprotein translocase subunit SecE [Chitinophagales bacterium]MBK9504539.1 preprotein translocase subunit SecE [Bacteroidota bacterium]MBK9557307.1 preprotein translocase subunit SecE [Bacteroidota bacterium]MBL0280472.1 preprotein translocase subunit SecE [Bacteroidota bacterium]